MLQRRFCVPLYSENGAVEVYGYWETFDQAQNWLERSDVQKSLKEQKKRAYGIVPFYDIKG